SLFIFFIFSNIRITSRYTLFPYTTLFRSLNMQLQIYNTYKYKRLNKLHEYIVFDLKHFVDEIIATISIIRGFVRKNKVYISSIGDRKSTRLNSSHVSISYAVFCLKKKKNT